MALAEPHPFHIGTCTRSISRGEIHSLRGENSLRLLSRGLGLQGSFSRAKDALFQDDNELGKQDDNEGRKLEVQTCAPPGFQLG